MVVLTSNRTREVHDALKRRCLYLWLDHPDVAREIEILHARLPGLPERLAAQVAGAVRKLRQAELIKPPGRRRDDRLGAGAAARRGRATSTSTARPPPSALSSSTARTPTASATSSTRCWRRDPHGRARAGRRPDQGLVGFTAVLRGAGLQVTTDRVAAFLAALDELDVTSRLQTYWAGRLTLCADPDDLPRYDQAFEQWFTPPRGGTRLVDERRPPPPKLASLDPGVRGGHAGDRGGRRRHHDPGPRLGSRGAAPPRPRRAHPRRARTPAQAAGAAAPGSAHAPVPAPAPLPARRSRSEPHAARGRARAAARCARCCAATGPGAPARSSCWSTSPARWSPTPTRCCGSRTS